MYTCGRSTNKTASSRLYTQCPRITVHVNVSCDIMFVFSTTHANQRDHGGTSDRPLEFGVPPSRPDGMFSHLG